jgi:uncharacterized protein (DUF779 family)
MQAQIRALQQQLPAVPVAQQRLQLLQQPHALLQWWHSHTCCSNTSPRCC